ncbi:hypothetical protein, partial [Mumia zhuanghuii]|uniref:hypothetical protein n=1 Tax=Mumia zhuanghuii TaxID=2585211 RepID=UPI003640C3C9
MRFKKTAAFLGATALVLLGGPAVAGPPHNISVGGATTGSYNVTGTSKGSIGFTVRHGSTIVNMGCTGATASGTTPTGGITAGAMPASGLIATLNAASTWAGCIGPGGLAMTVNQTQAWCVSMDPASQSSTAALTNVFSGKIEDCGNNASMATVVDTATNGAICSFTVSGTAHGSFSEVVKPNGTQDLTVNETVAHGHLSVTAVTGCLGAISIGDKASFNGV